MLHKRIIATDAWDSIVKSEAVWGPAKQITKDVYGVKQGMKNGKAGRPAGFVGDVLKATGSWDVKRIAELCNEVLNKGCIPRDWELCTLLPCIKGHIGQFIIQSSIIKRAWNESC